MSELQNEEKKTTLLELAGLGVLAAGVSYTVAYPLEALDMNNIDNSISVSQQEESHQPDFNDVFLSFYKSAEAWAELKNNKDKEQREMAVNMELNKDVAADNAAPPENMIIEINSNDANDDIKGLDNLESEENAIEKVDNAIDLNDYKVTEANDNHSEKFIDHSEGRKMDTDSLEQLEEKEAVVNDFLERNGSVEIPAHEGQENVDHSEGRKMDTDSLEQLEEKEAVVNDFLERNGSVELYENNDDESIR